MLLLRHENNHLTKTKENVTLKLLQSVLHSAVPNFLEVAVLPCSCLLLNVCLFVCLS